MSGMDDLVYRYDPEPEPLEPGVTAGYIVVWSGAPGPAMIAKAVRLVGDGNSVFQQTSDFTECEVVDGDTPDAGAGA